MKLLNNNCGFIEARNVEIYRRWLIAVKIEKRETTSHGFGAVGETLLIKTVFCEIIANATDSDSKESDDRV